MDKIKMQLERFIPFNEQETVDLKIILDWVNSGQDILTRDNQVAHITTSAWVVNKARTHVLMAYHNIYETWAWLGGHADGNDNLLQVACNEAHEESGIETLYPVQEEIFSLEILCVEGHVKRGEYVSSHLHLNFTYLLEADMDQKLIINEEENSDVAWIKLEDVKNRSKESWFVERIYSKLIDKMHA
ncbi:NUDIX hydrolase [Phocicoccus pinnipedialis]|uniref:Nudix hydrolase domain-containing protein n=1 Tax=Phocicoccus pinnipedialis TaxID=110845 RepID=A0A6V7RAV2_9BACL|nr:NUDIX hydrolase [Jeotgalicoccus pinnipedialis]MBP1939878.1 ADP-ribose pyrophosphatase YjhB (NUDIX family) [Jeotgalicoccus pinnipedialis]CAD2074677.1 hypothetical protein JEOPIN946_00812 [Jeotgalicoccus pinnipedialis]